jgi:hypothetical protein
MARAGSRQPHWTAHPQRSGAHPVHDGVMSELDVLIIHSRAKQAAEYERLRVGRYHGHP